MKKNILTVIIVLISTCSFAQKIKIDKGEIKLDEKTVGYVEGKKPLFKIYNLEKSYAVGIELKFLDDGAFGKRWMIVKSEKTGKSNEVDFKKFSPQNQEKSTVQAFLDQNFLTVDGLNSDVIENYINGESTGVSAKIKDEQNEIAKQQAYEDSYQLTIDDAGIIYSVKAQNPDPNDKRIGFIKMTLPSNNGELKYEVFDLDNYLIATWFAKSGTYSGYNKFLNQELITVDQKVFKANFDNRGNPIGYKMSKDITPMNIVKVLVMNGYTLEHQGIAIQNEINLANGKAREEQKKIDKEKYEKDKLNSKNIYDKKGYVINEKGEKITGNFKIEFEGIKNNSDNNTYSSFVPGQKLYQTDVKDHFQIYQAKSGTRFCIEEKGSEACYIGLTCIGKSTASSILNSLNADNSLFYKILYENNGYMILVYPIAENDFIIKIPTQEKGLYTNKSSNDKLKKNVSEYLKCDSFVFENYDFKILEGLIKVLEDYKNNCNK